MKKKCLLIGRHNVTEIEGHEVARHVNVSFPAHSWQCVDIIQDLLAEASGMGADYIIFQALPGQANVALWRMALAGAWPLDVKIGLVISRPGPRSADTVREGRSLTITVAAPMKFEFSHIEWLVRPVAEIEVEGGVASATDDSNVAITITDFDIAEGKE